jgi:hypothetical protein
MGALSMPDFETPQPITATLDVVLGHVRVSAGERDTTVVTVSPSDPANEDDLRAAELTRVEYANDHLLVKAHKVRTWRPRRDGGSVDVTVELPAGSALHAAGQIADFHCDGQLGDAKITTGIGRLHVEHAGALNLRCGAGDISVGRATGHAELTTAAGEVRATELGASAVIKTSTGATWVGTAGGDLRVKTADGRIAVDVARASVVAKTALGDVRLGAAIRGSANLETQVGDVEIGIPEGTAAWLDVRSRVGRVRNALSAAPDPGPAGEQVHVRARTNAGDIAIGRP